MGRRASLFAVSVFVYVLGCLGIQYGPFQARNGTVGLRWISIGDWGCDCDVQYDVAAKMGEVSETFDPAFFTLAGDNFYNYGIEGSAHDPRFVKTFENVYTAPSLQKKFYVVAGNHDYIGNVTAEIEYTQLSTRWTFPSRWYNQTFPIPGTNKTLLFLFIDTIIWAGPITEDDEHGKPLGTQPEYEWHFGAQKKWLEDQLNETTADWIVATGHYPIWSVGEHGPTPQLIYTMLPMFEAAGVAAYLNGHDHNTQHIQNGNMSFFVTGNGGKNSGSQHHNDSIPKDSLKFYQSDGGFLCLTFADTTFTAEFWAHNGTVTYSYTSTNPRDAMGLNNRENTRVVVDNMPEGNGMSAGRVNESHEKKTKNDKNDSKQ